MFAYLTDFEGVYAICIMFHSYIFTAYVHAWPSQTYEEHIGMYIDIDMFAYFTDFEVLYAICFRCFVILR
jgi:hypothetical protein